MGLLFTTCGTDSPAKRQVEDLAAPDSLCYPEEGHLRNMRQLTFGGDNAEAYWSFASDALIFQANTPAWNVECDQIYIMELGPDAQPLPELPERRQDIPERGAISSTITTITTNTTTTRTTITTTTTTSTTDYT